MAGGNRSVRVDARSRSRVAAGREAFASRCQMLSRRARPIELHETMRLRGRLLGLVMVGWSSGTRFADRRQNILAAARFRDPVTRLINEAQRLRFLEDGAHFASETVFTLTYQPPSVHKSRVERLIFSAPNTDTQAGPIPLDDFERESNDLLDPLRPWFDLVPLDVGETIAFIEECIGGIHQARLEPPYANFLDGSFAHEFVAGFRPQIDEALGACGRARRFSATSYPQILSGLNAIRAKSETTRSALSVSRHRRRKESSRTINATGGRSYTTSSF